MARKLRFFKDQVPLTALHLSCASMYSHVCAHADHGDGCVDVAQVEKSGLITGSRLGADREYDFDELEVRFVHP